MGEYIAVSNTPTPLSPPSPDEEQTFSAAQSKLCGIFIFTCKQLDWSLQTRNHTGSILNLQWRRWSCSSFRRKKKDFGSTKVHQIIMIHCSIFIKQKARKTYYLSYLFQSKSYLSSSWYLEDDFVVRRWGPAHPQGELARISLHMFCHTKLWCLRRELTRTLITE